jgi:hypothetical protein
MGTGAFFMLGHMRKAPAGAGALFVLVGQSVERRGWPTWGSRPEGVA